MEESYNKVEETRKRPLDDSNGERRSKRSNFGNDKPLLKFLVPNFVAGKLIGKGGSNINELQNKFDASIRVSPNKEFYPGTEDRIVTVSAETNQIIDFTSYMIENIQVDKEEWADKRPNDHVVKIVVTNIAAGLVIGKGGSTIKVIQEDSGAKINISKREESTVYGERILVISGGLEQRMKACAQIIEKISAEPGKMSNNTIKYGNSGNNAMNINHSAGMSLFGTFQSDNSANLFGGVPNNLHSGLRQSIGIGGLGVQQNYERKSRVKTTFQVLMEIPDSMVGAIMGKQGQTINEFSQISGAKIQFSAKNEFAPGTTDRILTIKGGMNQTQTAYFLIDEKVAQVENQSDVGLLRR